MAREYLIMTVPEIVRAQLGDEDPRARVTLGGDDELIVTPTRALVYRAEGLLSDESVEEYGHEAEAISLSEGRRKSTIRLDHGIDGDSELTVPSNRLDDVLGPILEGVFATRGVTAEDESVREVYRLGELTIVITDARVVKHIGNAIWDQDAEVFEFDRVTGIDTEEGEVSSQIIVEVDGRPERIKTPSDDARKIREQIQRALLAHYEVDTYADFRDLVRDEEAEEEAAESEDDIVDTSEDIDVVEAATPNDGPTLSDPQPFDMGSSTESADVTDEVAALREAVEHQNDLLEQQHETIQQLIEELRRGR